VKKFHTKKNAPLLNPPPCRGRKAGAAKFSLPLKGGGSGRGLAFAAVLFLFTTPAFAHVGIGSTASFAAGVAHPLSGLDHITVMVAVGLWAALKGGRSLWLWPATFVGVMLVGGALGMSHFLAHVPVPFVEPAILASVVALGLLVALAVDLPLWTGALIIGAFAVFHGHAHGSEVAENVGGIEYMAGFALATATLHAIGIGFGLAMNRVQARGVIRVAGAACVLIGAGLLMGVFQ
jgi:urease accessory protein